METDEKPPVIEFYAPQRQKSATDLRLWRILTISRIAGRTAIWIALTIVAAFYIFKCERWCFGSVARTFGIDDHLVWAWEPRMWGSAAVLGAALASLPFWLVYHVPKIAVIRREGEQDILLAQVNRKKASDVEFANQAIERAWTEMRAAGGAKIALWVQRQNMPLQTFDGKLARGMTAVIIIAVPIAMPDQVANPPLETPRLES